MVNWRAKESDGGERMKGRRRSPSRKLPSADPSSCVWGHCRMGERNKNGRRYPPKHRVIDEISRHITASGVSLSLSLSPSLSPSPSLSMSLCMYLSPRPHIGYRTHKVKLVFRGPISDPLNFPASERAQGKQGARSLLAFGEGDPNRDMDPRDLRPGEVGTRRYYLGAGGWDSHFCKLAPRGRPGLPGLVSYAIGASRTQRIRVGTLRTAHTPDGGDKRGW